MRTGSNVVRDPSLGSNHKFNIVFKNKYKTYKNYNVSEKDNLLRAYYKKSIYVVGEETNENNNIFFSFVLTSIFT